MPAYKRKTGTDEPTKIVGAVAATPAAVKTRLEAARKRFKIAVDAESEYRQAALDDLKFLTGEQWPQETRRFREQTHRPCLTINRLTSIKSQIVNEQRAQRPGVVVKPVGDGATVDDAEMLEGLLRHIQVNSDAEIAIDCAFEHMVAGGKGYIEVCRDYLPGATFDQELYIRRVKNPFTIYCDPSSIEPDESDANWKFKICDYPFDEYKALYPNSQLASLSDFSSIGDNFPGWGDSKTIRVAEYWHKEYEEETLYRMPDGSVLTKTHYDLRYAGVAEDKRIIPVDQRPWRKCTVYCTVMNGIEEIDEYTFPGRVGYIPLIPCLGEDFDVNGQRKLYGIVRNAKDAQRAINYFRSYAAETIALAPKAPWIGWKGQFKDPKWNNANVVNYAYLEADPVTTNGQQAPSLPERNQFEPPVQSILQMGQVIDGDIKAVTGIYEPSLGQTKTDQSGKAIDLLQKQGGLTNLNYTDNLSRTLRAMGRVLLDAAPYVYDSPRVQRILKPDGEADHVIVHSGRANAADSLKSPEIQQVYDLSTGVYDVVVDVGPSYSTKRQEAFNLQLQLAEADSTGTVIKSCLDIIIANSDMPGAREMANRVRKTMPPDLFTDDKGDPKVQLQQAQATIKQLEAHAQELMKQNSQMMDTIKTEQVQQTAKLEVAKLQAAAQVEIAGINNKLEQAKLDFAKFELLHGAAHERAMTAAGAVEPEGDEDTTEQGGGEDNGSQGD